MSERVRNGLMTVMLVMLAASAFVAGYFTNDFMDLYLGQGSTLDEGDFGVFWQAWDHIEENFLGELPSSRDVTYGAIRGSIALLDDPYTLFVEPVARDQERERLEGRFGGVGATLSRLEDDGPIVLEPIPDNPAAVAGVLSGDILLAVDGLEITAEMTVSEVAELIKGPEGTLVVLIVLHTGQTEPVEIEIERAEILLPSVTSRLLRQDDTIGYIELTRFSGESGDEVEEAIQRLQQEGAQQLILDLRHNGGGLLDASVAVADLFISEGPILVQQSRGRTEQLFEASSSTTAPDVPLVVLIDGATASAAEILAGALRDRQRATLIGSSTFGKGSVQLIFDLSDGSSIHVTSSRWLTPNRNQIDQQGLSPDIAIEVTQEAVDSGRDVALERAIEFFQDGR